MTAPTPGSFAAFRERVHRDPALQARLAEPGATAALTALVIAEAAAVGLAVSPVDVVAAMQEGHLAWLTCACEVV